TDGRSALSIAGTRPSGVDVLDFLAQYGLFLAKTLTLLAAFVVVVSLLANAAHQMREHSQDRLAVRSINRRLRDMAAVLNAELLDKPARKVEAKARKAEEKAR